MLPSEVYVKFTQEVAVEVANLIEKRAAEAAADAGPNDQPEDADYLAAAEFAFMETIGRAAGGNEEKFLAFAKVVVTNIPDHFGIWLTQQAGGTGAVVQAD